MAGPTTLLAVAAVVLALAPTPVSDQALRTEVDRLTVSVSAARHLPFHGPLAARAVGREGLRAELAAAIAGGQAGARGGTEPLFLKRLGLLPPDADYGQLSLSAYGASPSPSYDPTSRRLLVPDFLPLETFSLAHEIAHAVADQRFGIRKLLEIAPDGSHRLDGDAERARLALVEGDATLSALELADPKESFLDPRALAALAAGLRRASANPGAPSPPLWLAALERFTHVDGLLFLARVRAQRPWSAVDELWADPPDSSAEVLHPEKYDACARPLLVAEDLLPTLPGFGRPQASDVLGELMIRTWLGARLPQEIAERAAAGWAGDRAGVYGSPPAPLAQSQSDGGTPPTGPEPFAWLSVWDDIAEAADFEAAAGAAGVRSVARRGDAVALLLGVSDADAPALLAGMLDGWRKRHPLSRRPATAAAKRLEGGRPRPAARPGCPRRDRAAAPR